MTHAAALYLVPVLLGDTPVDQVLPPYNRSVVAGLRHFIVENVRSARRFLRKAVPAVDIDTLTFYELNQHTDPRAVASYLAPLEAGEAMGVISEAGCPAVADPGADVVALAQRKGLRVVPLVGPSSILLSVMASGMNGQSFAFNGYLPIDAQERASRLRQLEQRAWGEAQTQLFIETPYRNQRLMLDMVRLLRPETRLCVAASLTCEAESVVTRTVAQWRGLLNDGGDDAVARCVPREPAIFLIGRP